MYADVAVCLPLSRTFIYKLNEPVEIGCRVVVPFRKHEEDGFVVSLRNDAPQGFEIQTILKAVDAAPLISDDIFNLCRWISDYYLAPFGEVLKAALPPGITAKHVSKPGAGVKPAAMSIPKRNSEFVAAGFMPALTTDHLSPLFAIQEATGF